MGDRGLSYILGILQANKDKSFVDRILNPQLYPRIDLGQGNFATHQMAWGQVGNKFVVHPTILWNGKELTQYPAGEAWKKAQSSGNYIEFDTPEDAEWFSKNYKAVWKK